MTLYYSPGACSLAVHITLIEADIPFKTEKVDLRKKEYSGGSYLKINPKGSVPAIDFQEIGVLTEAAVILQYLADQKPEKHLIPRLGTVERYRCQEWLNYVSSEIHKGFSPLWNREMPEAAQTIFRRTLEKKFEYLSEKLSEKRFLMGDQFTVPDAYLFTVLRWSAHLKVDLAPHKPLTEYFERLKARPSVAEALKREGIAS